MRTMGMIYSAGDTQMAAARDPGAAITYLYFGSLGGDPFAQMALGYRHLYGIDAPQQCETALRYYRAAARTALRVHYGAMWVSALRRQDSAAKGAERGVGERGGGRRGGSGGSGGSRGSRGQLSAEIKEAAEAKGITCATKTPFGSKKAGHPVASATDLPQLYTRCRAEAGRVLLVTRVFLISNLP